MKIFNHIYKGAETLEVALCYHNIAYSHYLLKDFTQSEQYNKKALEIRTKILGPIDGSCATSHNNLASNYYALKRYDEAMMHVQKAIDILTQIYGPVHQDLVSAYSFVAGINRFGDGLGCIIYSRNFY